MAKVLVGICGSIAAYRSPDFIRELKAQGHELRVVLTDSASQFVTSKTIETFWVQRFSRMTCGIPITWAQITSKELAGQT